MTQIRWTLFLLICAGVMYWMSWQEQDRMRKVRAQKAEQQALLDVEAEKTAAAEKAAGKKPDDLAKNKAEGADKNKAVDPKKTTPQIAAAGPGADLKGTKTPPKENADPASKRSEFPVAQFTLGKNEDDGELRIYAKISSKGAVIEQLDLLADKDGLMQRRFTLLDGGASLRLDLKDEKLGDHAWEYLKDASKPPNLLVFRTTTNDGSIEIRKKFSVEPNSYLLGFDLQFRNLTDKPIDNVIYELDGPQNLPLEGRWYTQYYRRSVALMSPPAGASILDEQYASTVAAKGAGLPLLATPVRYAGTSVQYFASLVIQRPPTTEARYFQVVLPVVKAGLINEPASNDTNFANLAVQMTSTPIKLAVKETVEQQMHLFAGPKTHELLDLEPYLQLEIPRVVSYIGFMGMRFDSLSNFMVWFLNKIAKWTGDYGVAIIVMTVIVRIVLFPISFKQTITMQRMAEKMQILQPRMQEIREKYASDSRRMNQELMELYRKHNYNPISMFGGCLLLLLQMPIFVGLFQALQGSFELRDKPFAFTWIRDLAAPDQLFRFGFEVPFLGPYFNLLPLVSLVQMMLQMWLMTPPAATPEMEEQQKMSRRVSMIMMVWIGFLFYKVPAGLCLYIITSTSWALLEKKLMPKSKTASLAATAPAKASVIVGGNGSDESWRKPRDKKKRK